MFLAIVLVVAAGFVFFRFLLLPQARAYAQLKEELTKEESELQKAKALVASLGKENKKLAEVKKEVERVEGLFESEIRDGSVVILVGLWSAARNVDVTSLEPGEIKENEHTLELPFKIAAEGSFEDILAFCSDLENLSNFSEIRSLKIEAMDSPESPGMVKTNWEFVVYSTKTPEGRLYLEELARWNLGKYNLFYPAGAVAPLPELSGHLKLPPADSEESSSGNDSGDRSEDTSDVNSKPYDETMPALK